MLSELKIVFGVSIIDNKVLWSTSFICYQVQLIHTFRK